MYGLFCVGKVVELKYNAGLDREPNEGDSGFGLRHSKTANERFDEIFHQVPVGEVVRCVLTFLDNAAGRVQYKRNVCPRVTTSCSVNTVIRK